MDANLTALASAVNAAATQSALSAADAQVLLLAQDRSKQYNNCPASNVQMANGNTLEQQMAIVLQLLASAGSSAPAVTSAPSIAGTVGVGNALTITKGSVTVGSGGAYNSIWAWNLTSATGVVTQLFTQTLPSASSPSTLMQTAAMIGGTITLTQQAQDTTTGILSNVQTSNAKGPVTGSAPSGVSVTMSGSAAAGSTITATAAATGAGTYSFQFYAAGVAIGSRTAASASNTATIVSTNAQVGLAITASAIAYSTTYLVPSADTQSGNSITVTGSAPAVVNTFLPTWPGFVYLGTQATVTPGTWAGLINATRNYTFFRNGTSAANLIQGPQTLAVFTPTAAKACVAGDLLYVQETVFDAATGATIVGAVTSASVTLSAAQVTFAASTTNTGLAFTQGSAISTTTVVTMTGGTGPYALQAVPFSPALPAGLTASVVGSAVQISGTPSALSGQTTYTCNVQDSIPATASATFTMSVSQAGVTALAIAGFPSPTALEGYASGVTWDGVTTLTYNGINVLSVGADPLFVSVPMYVYRVDRATWATGTNVRAETVWIDQTQPGGLSLNEVPGVDYWYAFSVSPKATEWPPSSIWSGGSGNGTGDEAFLFAQWHSQSGGDTQPDLGFYCQVQTGQFYIQKAYCATAPTGGGSNQTTTNNIIWQSNSNGMITPGNVYKFIVHKRIGWTSGQNPIIEVWMACSNGSYNAAGAFSSSGANTYTLLYSNAGLNGCNGFTSYARIGVYKWKPANTGWVAGSYSTIAFYGSTIYVGSGTNLYANGVASLSAF